MSARVTFKRVNDDDLTLCDPAGQCRITEPVAVLPYRLERAALDAAARRQGHLLVLTNEWDGLPLLGLGLLPLREFDALWKPGDTPPYSLRGLNEQRRHWAGLTPGAWVVAEVARVAEEVAGV